MFLDKVVASTRSRIVLAKREIPLEEIMSRAEKAKPPKSFEGALRNGRIKVIAEIKRASPSKGDINVNLDVAALARAYERGGAAALSVLTEPEYFKGSLQDLSLARQSVELPILRKDFTIDPYQVYEARAWGADAVLLIAAILSDNDLKMLHILTGELGMAALVEVHNEAEVKKALSAGARLIGINNRNLATLTVSLDTTLRLRPLLPQGAIVVGESGIHTREDVTALKAAHIDAILVGESLVRSADPAARIREFVG